MNLNTPAAPAPLSRWVEWPERFPGIKAHLDEGWILVDGKPVKWWRNNQGNVYAYIPANGKVGRKAQTWPLAKLILMIVHRGIPAINAKKPKYTGEKSRLVRATVNYKDGNKWNVRTSNLEWKGIDEMAHRRVMDNDVPLKLNGHIALTLRDVVTRLAEDGIHDLDAIGSVFRISGKWVQKVINNEAWFYVPEWVDSITTKASDYQINKARERAALYADFDAGLAKHMAAATE